MSTEEGGPVGLLVLRLWTEPGQRMRVRVTSSTELRPAQSTTTYAVTEAEVLQLVAGWLEVLTAVEPR